MPSKKKVSKGKGSAVGGIIDGVDTSQMSREQLEIFCHRIKEENEREREERNYFQIERDRLRTFWEIAKAELEEANAKLRNKDRQIEEADEQKEEEIKFYKQKVKYLQHEHQNYLTESKAEAMVALKVAQDEHIHQERELLNDKQELKKTIREQQTSYDDLIKSYKLKHSEELNKIRKHFEEKIKEFESKYSKKHTQLFQELDTKYRMELFEVEERKNNQISELIKTHEKAFNDMKNYYNDITLNNLGLISSLKEQMEVLRVQNEKTRKMAADFSAENRRLVEPLKKAQAEVIEYKKQTENYKKDKLLSANVRANFYDTKKELDRLKWSNAALELSFEHLQVEYNELKEKFTKAFMNVQQKTNMKTTILQRKIQYLTETAEYREAVIDELTADTSPQRVNNKLEEILSNKNATIKDLQNELEKVCKAYHQLFELYQEKLEEFGISKEELDVSPIKIYIEEAKKE